MLRSVGTQSPYHSIHPNILEKSDRADHELAYWSVYADELLGKKRVEEMTGSRLKCAVPPGSSKSYAAMYAYADMGIPFYCDTVVTDGEDGACFIATSVRNVESVDNRYYCFRYLSRCCEIL